MIPPIRAGGKPLAIGAPSSAYPFLPRGPRAKAAAFEPYFVVLPARCGCETQVTFLLLALLILSINGRPMFSLRWTERRFGAIAASMSGNIP
jgi:hypothetical protein